MPVVLAFFPVLNATVISSVTCRAGGGTEVVSQSSCYEARTGFSQHPASVELVPEPATVLLAGLALAGIFAARLRRCS